MSWLKRAESVVLYRGAASPALGDSLFFTDSAADAADYADINALRQTIDDNQYLLEIVSEILSEEGGEDITDLGLDTLRDIITGNGFTLPRVEGVVRTYAVTVTNPLDLRSMGSDIGSIVETWNELRAMGLLDETWEQLDEYAREEIEMEYQDLSLYRFLEKEDIYSKAFARGHDAVIFVDRSPSRGTGTHNTWVIPDAAQVREVT